MTGFFTRRWRAGLTGAAALWAAAFLAGCYCYTGSEFVCDVRAVVLAPSDNEIAGCQLVGQPSGCIGCTRVEGNGSFEYVENGRPAAWAGDSVRVQTYQTRIRTTPPDDVLPCSWDVMLQMMATTPTGPGSDVVGEIFQVIDLRDEVLPDPAVAVADLMVDRVGTAFSDTQFGVMIEAYSGDADQYPNGGEQLLADSLTTLHTDGSIDTWEWVTTLLDLPGGTDFLVVRLRVYENARNEVDEPEFFGHYLDGLRVSVGRRGAFDASLVHRASPSSAASGESFVLETRIRHIGLDPVAGLVVELRPDEGMTYTSFSGDGSYDPVTHRWSVPELPHGGYADLEVVARADITPDGDTYLGSVAEIVAGADADVVPGNNAATAVLRVPKWIAYDLALSQAFGETTTMQGDSVTVTLRLSNNGPTETNAFIRVANVLPEGYTPQRYVATHGRYDAEVDRWAIDNRETVFTSADAVLNVTAVAGIPGVFTDPVEIVGGLGNLDDPGNNADSVTVTVTPSSTPYDLALTVDAEQSPFPADQYGGFVFRLRNNGPTIATGIVVEDFPPGGLSYAAAIVGRGTYDAAARRWSVPILLPGETAELTKRFSPASAGDYLHAATIVAGVEDDPDPGNDVDNAALTIVPVQPYDMSASLAFPDTLILGRGDGSDAGELVVTLANAGPGLTTPVQARVPIQPFLTYEGHTGDGEYLPHLGLWTPGGLLPAGNSYTLNISLRANRAGSGNMAVTVLSDQDRDVESDNDESTLHVSAFEPIRLFDPIPDRTMAVGEVARLNMFDYFSDPDGLEEFTAVLVDTAFVKLLDPYVIVRDTIVESSLSGEIGLYAVQAGVVDVRVTAEDSDGFLATDTFVVTATDAPYDLAAQVSSSTSEYAPGQTIPYSLTVTRSPSIDPLGGIRVVHEIPEGLVYQNHVAGNGTYDPGSGLWDFDMASGAGFAFVTINARADTAGDWTLASQILRGLSGDTDASNNADTFDLTVRPRYFLSMNGSVSADTIAVGEQVTIDLFVGNAGGNVATAVEASFVLPAGLNYVSDTGGGAYDPQTGTWIVGDVPVGPFISLRIIAEGATAGDWSGTASITAGLEFDADPGNNSDEVTVVVEASSPGAGVLD